MSSRRRLDVHRHHERVHEQNQLQNTKLDTLATKLDSVITNTANIQIEADAINLNTDELEAKLDTVITNTTGLNNTVDGSELQVDVVSGTVSATVAGVSTEAKQDSQITLLAGGLPSALSTDQLKVIDSGSQTALGLINTGVGNNNTLLSSLDTKASTRDGHMNNIVNQTSGLATESTLGDIDTKIDDRLPGALTTAGNLKVAIKEDTVGVATESTLSTLNGKITTGENDISAGTGAQQVLVYGKDAFAPFNLEPIRMSSDKILVESQISNVSSGITNSLPVSDSKITQGYDSQVASGGDGLQQVLCYGRDNSGNLDALRTDASGHLEITVDDFVKGNTTASASFPTTDASKKVKDVSWMTSETIADQTRSTSTLDTEGYAHLVIYGETTTAYTGNTIKIHGSHNNTDFYHCGQLSGNNTQTGKYYLLEDLPHANGGCAPRYLKVFNGTGGTISGVTLRATMSNFHEYQ